MNTLASEISMLRSKIGISQGELSSLIGISRQTLSAIETGTRKMSWGMYLSFIIFFDCNKSTHKLIRELNIFPEELVRVFNGGEIADYNSGIAGIPDSITEKLDSSAYHAIRTVVMLEYARCANLSGDAVIKSFDGISFGKTERNEKADLALKAIKESRRNSD